MARIRGPKELEFEQLMAELGKLRFVGADQNPLGIRDRLGSLLIEGVRALEPDAFKMGGMRRRLPQKCRSGNSWPPDMTEEDVEKAIDRLCGCAGGYNCDCVSVFNRARKEEWFRYNTSKEEE